MAAGMGSRYGGLKQIDPVDEQGNKIIDFSIYDAIDAGFEKVVFVIKKENEPDFRACVGDRIGDKIQIVYAYQELTNIPAGEKVPEGRIKPWGTAHAVLSAVNEIDGPFAVINSDDFYGREAFKLIYDYLISHEDNDKYQYTMVGYALKNTLTENGSVSRGVCETDADGFLADIVERTTIIKTEKGAAYTEDGENYTDIDPDSVVSMNMWGFNYSFLTEIKSRFERFFREDVPNNPLKAECYLPFVVDELLKENKAVVKVLKSSDKWFGVTYKEDKQMVWDSILALKDAGVYPKNMF